MEILSKQSLIMLDFQLQSRRQDYQNRYQLNIIKELEPAAHTPGPLRTLYGEKRQNYQSLIVIFCVAWASLADRAHRIISGRNFHVSTESMPFILRSDNSKRSIFRTIKFVLNTWNIYQKQKTSTAWSWLIGNFCSTACGISYLEIWHSHK